MQQCCKKETDYSLNGKSVSFSNILYHQALNVFQSDLTLVVGFTEYDTINTDVGQALNVVNVANAAAGKYVEIGKAGYQLLKQVERWALKHPIP